MKKKISRMTSLLLSLVLALALAFPAGAASLSDVAGSPYAKSIEALAEKAIVQGVGDGSYRPDDALTRSAAASMLYNAFYLVPVYSMEAAAPAEGGEALVKQFYSTDTTVAGLDARVE